MAPKLLTAAVALSWMLLAQAESGQIAQSSKTQRLDLGSSGSVRLEHSTGELTIEGWDQPAVEITTVQSMIDSYGPKDRENAGRKLGRVRITAQRRGADIVINTMIPGHHLPLLPHTADDVAVDYRLRVPRKAHLVIEHGDGEVHLENLAGDIEARVHRGMITLRVADQNQYQIDAKTKLGSIYSDFPGNSRHRFWRVGHQFLQDIPANAPKLRFRVGYGDIVILRKVEPKPTPGD